MPSLIDFHSPSDTDICEDDGIDDNDGFRGNES